MAVNSLLTRVIFGRRFFRFGASGGLGMSYFRARRRLLRCGCAACRFGTRSRLGMRCCRMRSRLRVGCSCLALCSWLLRLSGRARDVRSCCWTAVRCLWPRDGLRMSCRLFGCGNRLRLWGLILVHASCVCLVRGCLRFCGFVLGSLILSSFVFFCLVFGRSILSSFVFFCLVFGSLVLSSFGFFCFVLGRLVLSSFGFFCLIFGRFILSSFGFFSLVFGRFILSSLVFCGRFSGCHYAFAKISRLRGCSNCRLTMVH